jgi:hypothetical protein
MNTFTLFRFVLGITLLMSFVSCGQKPMVTDVQVKPHYEVDELYIQLDADLAIGRVQLPAATIPIYMPKTFELIGSVEMTPEIGGTNHFRLDVNVSKLSKLEAKEAQLPNGAMIPLIASNKTIEIPIRGKVHLYLTIGEGKLAIGAAVPFKNLDGLGAKTGTTAIMPVFNFNQVAGAAGLYLSKEAGKNGFAIVADASELLDNVDFIILGADEAPSMELAVEGLTPSSTDKKIIDRKLARMNSRREVLRLH